MFLVKIMVHLCSTNTCEDAPNYVNKSKNDTKEGKYFVRIKFCRYPKLEKSDFYEIEMALFDNSKPEDFLSFLWNLK